MKKLKYELCDVGARELAYRILRQAAKDYYECCIFPHKLPRRVKTVDYSSGHPRKRPMTDHERHLYVVQCEMDRRGRKAELEKFFFSEWYYILSEREDDEAIGATRRFLDSIIAKRKSGKLLFEKDD